jgi:hypothetical protein
MARARSKTRTASRAAEYLSAAAEVFEIKRKAGPVSFGAGGIP